MATTNELAFHANGTRRVNVSQLRDRIDRGLTGDKVDWPDPAVAPLGTDEEAAGCAISAEAVAMAYRNECLSMRAVPVVRFGPAIWLYALFIVLVALVLGWGALQSGST